MGDSADYRARITPLLFQIASDTLATTISAAANGRGRCKCIGRKLPSHDAVNPEPVNLLHIVHDRRRPSGFCVVLAVRGEPHVDAVVEGARRHGNRHPNGFYRLGPGYKVLHALGACPGPWFDRGKSGFIRCFLAMLAPATPPLPLPASAQPELF